jgi:hypothetical protein
MLLFQQVQIVVFHLYTPHVTFDATIAKSHPTNPNKEVKLK